LKENNRINKINGSGDKLEESYSQSITSLDEN
jgi:hypothetical protein